MLMLMEATYKSSTYYVGVFYCRVTTGVERSYRSDCLIRVQEGRNDSIEYVI